MLLLASSARRRGESFGGFLVVIKRVREVRHGCRQSEGVLRDAAARLATRRTLGSR
ncbi:hypothetical protein KCP70_06690 [Salmonella enterica subsp. enterica]|nr:hypothetical protein KCP70_06690 [Salmonella enterica subsp. enterica]